MNDNLKQARVIQGALTAGVFFALVLVVAVAYRQPAGPRASDAAQAFVRSFTFFHAALFMLSWRIAPWLRRTVEDRIRPSEAAPAERLPLVRWQAGRLVELVIRESPAFFGLLICFVGVQSGALRELPLYWINALSAILFILYGLLTMPTEASIPKAS